MSEKAICGLQQELAGQEPGVCLFGDVVENVKYLERC